MEEKRKDETKAKTSIKIDPVLWKEAKIEAIKHDTELSELVERGLKAELQKLKKMGEAKLQKLKKMGEAKP